MIYNLYEEKYPDLEKFEQKSKFYRFLEPLSKNDIKKRLKVKIDKKILTKN